MNYYSVLGISKDSTATEIKYAYRSLAKEYHPDINKTKGAEAKFKMINEAYEVLGNPQKKKKYDSPSIDSFGTFSGFGNSSMNMNDFFNTAFNFNHKNDTRPKQKKTFTSEAHLDVHITFEESIFGIQNKSVKHSYKSECLKCSGHGGEFDTCGDCGGKGLRLKTDGFISVNTTCTTCKGTGKKRTKDCVKCGNKGYSLVVEEIDVNIPEGIEERTQLLVRGKGHKINGKRGDLYLSVKVDEKEDFAREKNNIIQTVYVNVLDILTEKTIVVESLRTNYEIDLTDMYYDKEIIYKNQGTKTVKGSVYGDLVFRFKTYIPKLTNNQKEILKSIK